MVPLADGVADTVVAALGLSAVAAWMALTWRAGCRPGSGCSCSVAAERSARPRSAPPAPGRAAGWWPCAAPGGASGPAAGADAVVALPESADVAALAAR